MTHDNTHSNKQLTRLVGVLLSCAAQCAHQQKTNINYCLCCIFQADSKSTRRSAAAAVVTTTGLGAAAARCNMVATAAAAAAAGQEGKATATPQWFWQATEGWLEPSSGRRPRPAGPSQHQRDGPPAQKARSKIIIIIISRITSSSHHTWDMHCW